MPGNGVRRLEIYQHLKMIELFDCFYILTLITEQLWKKMTLNEMKELVLKYVIKEYIDDDDVKITYETPLISSGYVDSFSMVSLLVFLENKFKIKIPPSKATPEAFDSVNNIVALVNQYLKQINTERHELH
ncbi:MAG: acyl carrier protein [Marinilabiliales bacterium]|nr:acyl carrier protein [Marinilabiliales bacterium]